MAVNVGTFSTLDYTSGATTGTSNGNVTVTYPNVTTGSCTTDTGSSLNYYIKATEAQQLMTDNSSQMQAHMTTVKLDGMTEAIKSLSTKVDKTYDLAVGVSNQLIEVRDEDLPTSSYNLLTSIREDNKTTTLEGVGSLLTILAIFATTIFSTMTFFKLRQLEKVTSPIVAQLPQAPPSYEITYSCANCGTEATSLLPSGVPITGTVIPCTACGVKLTIGQVKLENGFLSTRRIHATTTGQ